MTQDIWNNSVEPDDFNLTTLYWSGPPPVPRRSIDIKNMKTLKSTALSLTTINEGLDKTTISNAVSKPTE